MNLTEAFKKLEVLNEEAFNISDSDAFRRIKEFKEDADKVDNFVDIIDLDAETEEDLKDSYVGKVILKCVVCNSKLFKDVDDVVVDDYEQLANIDEECPYCHSTEGYKVLGKITDYEPATEDEDEVDKDEEESVEDDIKDEEEDVIEDEEEIEESLNEAKCDKFECGIEATANWPMTIKCIDKKTGEEKEFDIEKGELIVQKVTNKSPKAEKEIKGKNSDDDSEMPEEDIIDAKIASNQFKVNKDITDADYKWYYKHNEIVEGSPDDEDFEDLWNVFTVKPDNEEKDEDESLNESVLNEAVETNMWARSMFQATALPVDPQKDEKPKKIKILRGYQATKTSKGTWECNGYTLQDNTPDSNKDLWLDYDPTNAVYVLANNKNQYIGKNEYGTLVNIKYDAKEKLSQANEISKLIRYGNKFTAEECFATKEEAQQALDNLKKSDWGARFTTFQVKELAVVSKNSASSNLNKRTIKSAVKDVKDAWGAAKSAIDAAKAAKAAAASNESLDESIDSVNINSLDKSIDVKSDDTGALDIHIENTNTNEAMPAPEAPEEFGEEAPNVNATEGEEFIAPLDNETIADIENNSNEEDLEELAPEEPAGDEMIDVDVDDFDEESFDDLGESYLKGIYENVNSFKTTSVKSEGNKLFVEGLINFKSGKTKATNFIFEAKDITKKGKARFIGENCQICRGKKAFTVTGTLKDGQFISESLNYNYRTKNSEGKSSRLYGTVKLSESYKKNR